MSTSTTLKIITAINDAATVIAALTALQQSALVTGREPTDEEVDATLAKLDANMAALRAEITASRAAGG